jgi:hypothetical protein
MVTTNFFSPTLTQSIETMKPSNSGSRSNLTIVLKLKLTAGISFKQQNAREKD